MSVPFSVGTNIRILSGVPFSSDYKHTRWFANVGSQHWFFYALPRLYESTQFNVQRTDKTNYIAVNKGIEELRNANYIQFQNTNFSEKWFYAFVTHLEYVNKQTTNVHFQIDVVQTWMFELNFNPSFVVREHCQLWNSDGTPVINTLDEDLNYGTDYDIVSVKNYVPYTTSFDVNGKNYFLVIVTKKQMHTNQEGIKPILNGIPQPLSYYIHPFKLDGTVPTIMIDGIVNAMSSIKDVIRNLSMQDDAVNNIVTMYVTELTGVDTEYNPDTDSFNFSNEHFQACVIEDAQHPYVTTIYVRDIDGYGELQVDLGDKYNDFILTNESKLLMYPYTCTVLSDLKGNQTILKNEYINGKNLKVFALGSLGTSSKVAYGVLDYLQNDNFISKLQNAIVSTNPNEIPIVTDYLSAFLQGNRNSLANQKNSIIFNQGMNRAQSATNIITSATYGNFAGASGGVIDGLKSEGNSMLKIQAQQAKIADIDNTPPSLSSLGGNTNFDFGNGVSGLFVIKKQIKIEYIKRLKNFFKMFGYKVNELKVPNIHTREHFNYVQTSNCFIKGDFNQEDKVQIMKIFDNGITLWHTDDVGNYDLENGVI